jgi:hypothetical protein
MHTLFGGINFAEDFFWHVFLVTLSIGQKVINAINNSPLKATESTEKCVASDSFRTQ